MQIQTLQEYHNLHQHIKRIWKNVLLKCPDSEIFRKPMHEIALWLINEKQKFEYDVITLRNEDINRYEQDKSLLDDHIGPKLQPPSIKIVRINQGQNLFNVLDKHYQPMPQIGQALGSDAFKHIGVYQTEHEDIFIAFTENSGYKGMGIHELLPKIISLTPHFYNIQISEEIKEILKYYALQDEKWIELFRHYVQNNRIEENIVLEELKKILDQDKNHHINYAKQNIKHYRESARAALQDWHDYTDKKEIEERKLFDLTNQPEADPTELFRYLKKHPNIEGFKVRDDDKINITFFTPLLYFEKEPVEKILNNNRHEIHGYQSWIPKLFYKTFIENKYKIYCQTSIGFTSKSVSRADKPREIERKAITQPHIGGLNCFGDNLHPIEESLRLGLYEEAIEQTIGALMNMNFYDSSATREFIYRLQDANNSDYQFIYNNETKQYLTIQDVKEELENDETDSDILSA